MTKRTVWFCILGPHCECDEPDPFCVNTRRREVEDEDHEEATQEEAPLLPDVQAAQNARGKSLERQRA